MVRSDRLLAEAALRLAAAGVEDPRREARLLLNHLLGLAPGALAAGETLADAGAYAALLRRREAREPLALITAQRGFWTLELEVSPATLIPRADSETLIETAQTLFADRAPPGLILDLGSGTGCLLLAALTLFPGAFGLGVERDPAAAALGARNARRNGLAARAAFIAGRWGDALGMAPDATPGSAPGGRFGLVLTNPPYIPSAAIGGLMPEVRLYEPALALDGGADGLDAYREILAVLPRLLARKGVAILELGQGQAPALRGLAEAAGLHYVSDAADLGGVTRAMVLCRADDAAAWAAPLAQKTFGSPGAGS